MIFVLSAWCIVSFFHQDHTNGNEMARLSALFAIVCEHRIAIDTMAYSTPNSAQFQGHTFSDKPPGVTILALPAFWIAIKTIGVPSKSISDPRWRHISWIATAGSVGLLYSVGLWSALLWLQHWVSPLAAYLTTVCLGFGSLAFDYAGSLSPVASAPALIFLALERLSVIPSPVTLSSSRLFVGGFLLGFAGTCDYCSGVGIAGCVLWCILNYRLRSVWTIGGCALCFGIILANNYLCFGSLFRFGYLNNESFAEMQRGFFGLSGHVSIEHLLEQLFGAKSGSVVWSPILILVPFGCVHLIQQKTSLSWIVILVIVGQIGILSSYAYWDGYEGVGTRFHSPVLPFCALAIAEFVDRHLNAGVAVGVLSVLISILITSVGIFIPPESHAPWTEYVLPRTTDGLLAGIEESPSLSLQIRAAMLIISALGVAYSIRLWSSYRNGNR